MVFVILIGVHSTAYAMDKEPVIWVQVPQWTDDWAVCAVDIPDAACHWYVADADNTFGEGFDWETAPWFDANGLNDVAPISKKNSCTKITRGRMNLYQTFQMFLLFFSGTVIVTSVVVIMMSAMIDT